MRLITELCEERGLAAIINIHDVLLAQMFSKRVVGLQLGEIVYDGAPEGLGEEVLTRIYGEEDWSATIGQMDDASDAGETDGPSRSEPQHGPHMPSRAEDVVSGL